jgi:protein-S-isoprenylcysteine O-methyltransferase Ste14
VRSKARMTGDLRTDLEGSDMKRGGSQQIRRYGSIPWVFTSLAPAVALGFLAISQIDDALRNGVSLTTNPNWPTVIVIVREVLYASFILGAAVVLSIKRYPQRRDSRGLVAIASLAASFLLVGVGFLPSGPMAWESSSQVSEIGLFIGLIGAAFAFAAIASLRANFSIVPEAHSLVMTGPYRWLRHPMYFAELLMIVGLAVGGLRITVLIGAVLVIGLQIYRVRVEERLLRATFPTTFEQFVSRTPYRLIPLVW